MEKHSWITVREAARRLGVTAPAVTYAVKHGRLGGLTDETGRVLAILASTLNDYKRKRPGNTPIADGEVRERHVTNGTVTLSLASLGIRGDGKVTVTREGERLVIEKVKTTKKRARA